MTVKEKITLQLADNIAFIQKTEQLMCKIEIQNNNKRDMLLASFSRNLLTHFISISFLIEKKLYNSAFALERIFFENIIKLKYMYYIMDDTKITKIYKANNWDKHFPSIQKMVDEIDMKFEVKFYATIKSNAYQMMNDYTHTGSNQIARNFSEIGSCIEANFSDELILNTLEGNKNLSKTSIIVFLESIGLKNNFLDISDIEKFLEY